MRLVGVVVAGLLTLSACNADPAAGKAVATVSEPAKAAEPPAPAGVAYAFSNADSKLEFVGAKVTRKHDGAFGSFHGTLQFVADAPEKSQVSVEVDTGSLTADDPKLSSHLRSPDLLDVEKFPKARFRSTAIRAGGEKGATHTISGNLELHGVTRGISFPATVRASGDSVEVDSEFVINRKDFGIEYPGMPDDLIKDDVLLKLTIRAKKS